MTVDASPLGPLPLVPVACPVCGSRAYDPAATGQRFPARDGDPTYLMARCLDCGVLYLNPRPELPAAAYGECEEDRARRTVDDLGTSSDPVGELRHLAGGPSDELTLVVPNADSGSRHVFGGRHWSHYDFPRSLQVFGRESIGGLAAAAGYRVAGLRTRGDAAAWRDSMRNFLADWGASSFWVRAAERGVAARVISSLVEEVCRLRGRGSMLEVRLVRATTEPPGEDRAPRAPAVGRKPEPVAILGAGVAGLTAAVELQRRGVPATVYEASSRIAGLAQSYRDEDGFSHDFGAHFITNRFAAALGIGSACGTVHRFGEAVHLDGRTYGYPFGLLRTPRFVSSAIMGRLRPDGTSGDSAADFYRREFGHRLADQVAIPLVEAWSGAAAADLASSVSPPQLDRGIAHVLQLKMASRWSGRAVANGFSRAQPENPHVFHVYPYEGVSSITSRLADELQRPIELESRVEAIYVEDECVRGIRVAGEDREVSTVISTAPVHVLPKMVRGTRSLEPLARFRYRPFSLVNMRFATRPVLPEVCTWIPEREYTFFRLTEAPLAMPWLAPEGKTIVTADIGCEVGDRIWTMDDDELGEVCAAELDRLFPGVREHYLGCQVLRTGVAHPVYLSEYEDDRIAFGRGLPVRGLYSVGRNGEFAHILMEDVFWLTRQRIRDVLHDREP